MPYTLFISDLHLDEDFPETTAIFTQYLQREETLQAEALYILGDLFEFWLGDDHNTLFHQSIAASLRALSQTVPIYFMRGNRDFLVGRRFCKVAGMQFLKDPTVINLYGIKTIVAHGDALCTQDIAHQKFR